MKNYYEIFIEYNIEELIQRNQKNLYNQSIEGKRNDVVGTDLPYHKANES